MVTPYGGSAAGLTIASDYKEKGFAASVAMVPGFAITGGLSNGSYDWGHVFRGADYGPPTDTTSSDVQLGGLDSRIGLPVSNEKMNKLCSYAADQAVLWLEDWVEKIPIIGLIMKIPGLKRTIASIIASSVTTLSCNEYTDSFWRHDGPKAPYMGQDYANGASDWHQVYGFVFGSQKDVSENKVALGMGPKGGFGHRNTSIDQIYQAEAEFFFDCDTVWTDEGCNRPGGRLNQIPHAMYSMRWMVRLRRVHFPNLGGMGLQMFTSMLGSSQILGPIKGAINGSPTFQAIKTDLDNIGGGFLGKALGGVTKTGNGSALLDSGLGWVLGKIPSLSKPPASGIIH
jgi:hypothetical protein